jgi:hypothetical protein
MGNLGACRSVGPSESYVCASKGKAMKVSTLLMHSVSQLFIVQELPIQFDCNDRVGSNIAFRFIPHCNGSNQSPKFVPTRRAVVIQG